MSGIPGLDAMATTGLAGIERAAQIDAESISMQASLDRAGARLEALRSAALAGRPVDLLEVSILQSLIKHQEARRDELMAEAGALAESLEATTRRVDGAVTKALIHRGRAAKAARQAGF